MLEKLKLERPIAFIDVETTGKGPRSARIVELLILKVQPDGSEEHESHRVNPEVPIPAEAIAIHGITDVDVAGEPAFRQYAKGVIEFLGNYDVAGFNVIRFDLPVLYEMPWLVLFDPTTASIPGGTPPLGQCVPSRTTWE